MSASHLFFDLGTAKSFLDCLVRMTSLWFLLGLVYLHRDYEKSLHLYTLRVTVWLRCDRVN